AGEWDAGGAVLCMFVFSSRRRHTRLVSDWSSDVCSSDLAKASGVLIYDVPNRGNGRVVGDRDGHMHLVSGWQGDIAPTPEKQTEIGRASCRERAWTAGVGRRYINEQETVNSTGVGVSRDE